MRVLMVLWIGAALLAGGCSTLQSEIQPGLDRSRYETLVVQGPQPDPWRLEDAARESLLSLGYRVLEAPASQAQGVIRVSSEDRPDINEDGKVISRPKSVQVDLLEVGSQALLARTVYTLPSTLDVAAGVRIAINKLHADMHRSKPQKASQVQPEPPAVPVAATDPEPAPVQNAEPVVAPQRKEAAVESKESVPAVEPVQRSPGIPRFDSWGFAIWGK